tara:strand:- start:5542 stop:6309 length:768 start_codon:yes stop_codon:yes gene_type:complete
MVNIEIRIKDILEWVKINNYDYKLSANYNSNHIINCPSTTKDANDNNISFSLSTDSNAGVLFSLEGNDSMLNVLTDNPKLDFIKCITEFYPPEPCNVIQGKNVKIGKNCSIGSSGFGVVRDSKDGSWVEFPHYGNIILGDDVWLGDNNTITRGTLGDTIIGNGVKTDCGVHIAHNSIIGDNCMFAAKAMIAGSVTMGENCWVGPSSSIINKAVIGNNVFIGIGSNVIKDIPDNVVVAGNPAKIIKENKGLWNSVK